MTPSPYEQPPQEQPYQQQPPVYAPPPTPPSAGPPIAAPMGTPYAPPPSVAVTGDTTGGVIPYKNPKALLAYYIGLFSLVPCAGHIMGPAALVLGIGGLKYAKQYPIVKGQVHAWVGIVCGGFWTLVWWGLTIMMIVGIASEGVLVKQ